MRPKPPPGDDERGERAPRGEGTSPAQRLTIDSVRPGASGTAIIAAGGSSFTVDAELLEALGLALPRALQELDEAASGILSLAAEAHEAQARGLSLLGRAEQSRHMLQLKLAARGFGSRAIGLALDRLAASGALDDGRYAEAYVASRLTRKPEGPRSLRAELRARGIDDDTAKRAVSAALGSGGRLEALTSAVGKLRRRGLDRDELRDRLRELGYTGTEISEYFDSIEA